MKKYRFDYIRESVEECAANTPKTLEFIEGLPFGILLYPQLNDPYGETIENFEDWYKQRHEYCEKLANEYKNNSQ